MAVKQFRIFGRDQRRARENLSSRLTKKQSPSAAGSFLRLTPKSNCVDGVANFSSIAAAPSALKNSHTRAKSARLRANKQFRPNHHCRIRRHTHSIYTPRFLSVIVDNLLSLSLLRLRTQPRDRRLFEVECGTESAYLF